MTQDATGNSTGNETRTRNVLLAIALVVGLGIALVPLGLSVLGGDPPEPETPPAASGTSGASATGEEIPDATTTPDPVGTSYTVGEGQRIDCPTPDGDAAGLSANAELADVTLPCLTDGGTPSTMSVAELTAGRPTLINVWAWWCGPCRQELPVLQEVAENHPEWNIVGVHVNERGQAGVDLLSELDVRFASFQDSSGDLVAAANLPAVVPLSLIMRPDGTRAELHPGELTSVDEVEELMTSSMGAP